MKKTILTIVQLSLFCITQKVCAQYVSQFNQNQSGGDTSRKTKSGPNSTASDTSKKMKNNNNNSNGSSSNYYYQNQNTRDTSKRMNNTNSTNQSPDQRKKGTYKQNNTKANRDSTNR